jgi:hypothetical protein
LRDAKEGPNSALIQEFLTILAVCHTVIPEVDEKDPNKSTHPKFVLFFICHNLKQFLRKLDLPNAPYTTTQT